MVQTVLLNSAPGGFGVPRATPGDPQGSESGKFPVFWWTPVCQNTTMPGPETELYGVKQHSGVVRWPRLAAGRLGFALEGISGQPWARS